MRVLVTRPKSQSEQLIKSLSEQGYDVDSLPLLEISPLPLHDSEVTALASRIEKANIVIAVSANAAQRAIPVLKSADIRFSNALFAIGSSTASVLRYEGYRVQIPKEGFNSENLLLLPEFADIEGKKVEILCGKGGRDYLEQKLTERGASVGRIELYARTAIAEDQLDVLVINKPDVLTAMSGDTVNALANALSLSSQYQSLRSWMSLPLVVPSIRVAGIASEKGFTDVHIADKPTTESLLKILVTLAEGV